MNTIAEKISDAELFVMKELWKSDAAMSMAQLKEALHQINGWDGSTVKTLVNRLCEKGAIIQEKRTVFFYSASLSEEEYHLYATSALIEKLYGGSPKKLVASLVQTRLSKEDIAELQAILNGGEET